ncbi:MAG: 1-phosphofructokinase [Candidatus Coproplasma sp.]
MIYTVTFNPSLDYYVKVNNIKQGVVNRTAAERLDIGGKGINVSLELKELGDQTMALGFVAGFTGKAICDKLDEHKLLHDFIEVEGQSRINVKIKSIAETDINGSGADITDEDVKKLAKKLKKTLKSGDWLIISGSVPASLGENAYSNFIEEINPNKNVNIVIDACGKLLTESLRHKPFLIKPNIFELCEIFGLPPTGDTLKIVECARKLQKLGARNVIVSMGADGAVMVTETDQSMYVRAARGQLVNSVGAGDCMVAGFIHEYIRTGNYFKSLNFATAAGSATAFTDCLATKEQIEYVESLML